MILVTGAGPGGLAAALALHQVGLDVTVWERAPQLRTAGAGLTLQINAMRMLATLGMDEKLRRRGTVLKHAAITDHRGRTIQSLPLSSWGQRFGQAGVSIHRGELSQALLGELPPGTVEFGRGVVGLEQDQRGVTVHDQSGSRSRFSAVIGADGIHSCVREALFGRVELRYAGYTCWRGVAPVPGPLGRGRAVERWGPGLRFGVVPIAEDATYWFATATAPAGGGDGPDPRAELLERFVDFESTTRALIEATPRAALMRNDIYDFAPLRAWTQGRVTLLGDAAHAMTPNLGQGACQAIEDAAVLADAVARDGAVLGLKRYESARLARARGFVRNSERFGKLAQLHPSWLRWLRDRLMTILGRERLVARRLAGVYGVEVPELRSGSGAHR